MFFVELEHFFQWVFADNVGIEHEEGRVVGLEDLLGESDRASGTERLVLQGTDDFDTKLLRLLLQKDIHDLGLVVDGKDDLGDADCDQRLDLVEL